MSVKTKFDNRPLGPGGAVAPAAPWAYIPIPYFIPSQLYNNLFAAGNLPHHQYYPGGLPLGGAGGAAGISQAIQNQLHEGAVGVGGGSGGQLGDSPVVQLQSPALKQLNARGRLTRQTSTADSVEEMEQELEQEDAKETATSATDSISTETTANSSAQQEMKASDASEAVNKLPTAAAGGALDSGMMVITNSSSSSINNLSMMSSSSTERPSVVITTEASTSPPKTPSIAPIESFEVSAGEREDLGMSSSSAAAVNNTLDSLQSNQTSSYYRRIQQSFDPDAVSFTTWYPIHTEQQQQAMKQELFPDNGPVQSATLSPPPARPFRPSQEYNEAPFQPILALDPWLKENQSQMQQGLEPPELPSAYSYPYV